VVYVILIRNKFLCCKCIHGYSRGKNQRW